jgi:hypothetical protein
VGVGPGTMAQSADTQAKPARNTRQARGKTRPGISHIVKQNPGFGIGQRSSDPAPGPPGASWRADFCTNSVHARTCACLLRRAPERLGGFILGIPLILIM